MIKTDSSTGRMVLMLAHIAGMVDLIALPLWVGALISSYHFNPQQAGGLVTLFLLGAVASNIFFAPRFQLISGRLATSSGFALASLSFLLLSVIDNYGLMAVLHVAGGIGVGCGLSFTHGTIGRSVNPHRLFGIVGFALGVFGLLFFGIAPRLINLLGGQVLFQIFAAVMFLAALATAVAFPQANATAATSAAPSTGPLSSTVWLVVVGMTCMALTHSTVFSFVERIGIESGVGQDKIAAVLMAVGIVTLLPAVFAAVLQRKLSASRVAMAGPMIQVALALAITQAVGFWLYAAATVMMPFILLFTHIFVFGLLARMDPTCRAVALTPAMLMTGSALGPILGGTLAHNFGYSTISIAACITATIGFLCFMWASKGAITANKAQVVS